MKKRILVLTALLLVSVVTLSSCTLINNVVDFVTGIFNPSVQLTDAPLGADMLIDFAKSVPEDKAEMVLRVMRSIVESD